MQQVYDTDLDRLLICTDPAKRVWRDAMKLATPCVWVKFVIQYALLKVKIVSYCIMLEV